MTTVSIVDSHPEVRRHIFSGAMIHVVLHDVSEPITVITPRQDKHKPGMVQELRSMDTAYHFIPSGHRIDTSAQPSLVPTVLVEASSRTHSQHVQVRIM